MHRKDENLVQQKELNTNRKHIVAQVIASFHGSFSKNSRRNLTALNVLVVCIFSVFMRPTLKLKDYQRRIFFVEMGPHLFFKLILKLPESILVCVLNFTTKLRNLQMMIFQTLEII